jgi:hypothetical protein
LSKLHGFVYIWTMKRALFFFFFFSYIYIYVWGQNVHKKISNPDLYFQCVRTTSDSGFVFSGVSARYPAAFFTPLVKFDKNANLVWYKKYPYAGTYLNIFDVYETINNEFLITGTPYITTSGRPGVVYRIDSNGNSLWRGKIYNSVVSSSLTEGYKSVELFNSIYTCGYIYLQFNNITYLIKLDLSGNFIWKKAYTASSGDRDLITTNDGHLLLTGRIGSNQSYIARIDTSGNVLWSRKYSTTIENIVEMSNNDIVVYGYPGNCIARINSVTGNVIWCKRFYNPSVQFSYPYPTLKFWNNSFLITGTYGSTSTDNGVAVIRLDTMGEQIHTYGVGRNINSNRYAALTGFSSDKIVSYSLDYDTVSAISHLAFLDTSDQSGECLILPFSIQDSIGSLAVDTITIIEPSTNGIDYVLDTTSTFNETLIDSLLCSSIGIHEIPIILQWLEIFPNPIASSSSLTFTYPSTSAKKEIIIYSIHGKEIARYALPQWSSTQTVKLPQMAGGVYVARMVGEGESVNVKFVIE